VGLKEKREKPGIYLLQSKVRVKDSLRIIFNHIKSKVSLSTNLLLKDITMSEGKDLSITFITNLKGLSVISSIVLGGSREVGVIYPSFLC
jgi:hypothetical protein